MAITKHKRISEVRNFPNVFLLLSEADASLLKTECNYNKIFTLEIGCGHGDYSVELAKRFPERKFIGIDIKGARIHRGAMIALEEKLTNVFFIIGRAEKLIEILPSNSVEEIYIPFPDPHVRRTSENRRLISPNFLNIHKTLLTERGVIHLKTDNEELYEYALKVITEYGCKILFQTKDLYRIEQNNSFVEIKTRYEEHYIREGRNIRYIKFMF
jgi:tRNA (guanine-N7-)-methyltransferase